MCKDMPPIFILKGQQWWNSTLDQSWNSVADISFYRTGPAAQSSQKKKKKNFTMMSMIFVFLYIDSIIFLQDEHAIVFLTA